MYPDGVRTGVDHGAGEMIERHFGVLVVDADPALDGDGNFDRGLHGGDAIADERRLGHQAGAEAARLDAVGRAADIEIDLVIADFLGDAGGLGEGRRLGAAQLQGDRVFIGGKAKQAVAVAETHGVGRHHLAVKQRMTGQLPVEHAAMAVRPLHHRRDGETPSIAFLRFYLHATCLHALYRFDQMAIYVRSQPFFVPFRIRSRRARSRHREGPEAVCTHFSEPMRISQCVWLALKRDGESNRLSR